MLPQLSFIKWALKRDTFQFCLIWYPPEQEGNWRLDKPKQLMWLQRWIPPILCLKQSEMLQGASENIGHRRPMKPLCARSSVAPRSHHVVTTHKAHDTKLSRSSSLLPGYVVLVFMFEITHLHLNQYEDNWKSVKYLEFLLILLDLYQYYTTPRCSRNLAFNLRYRWSLEWDAVQKISVKLSKNEISS